MASHESSPSTKGDPCGLLDPKEVESVLGAALATPPYRSNGGASTAAADGEHCIYVTSDFHYIDLDVDFTGGAEAYGLNGFGKKLMNAAPDPALKKALKLDDGTELTGEWDEATLVPMNCCLFAALRGDQQVQIDFAGSNVTLAQAAGLVDSALKRIDKPLEIDGGAHIDQALALAAQRPKEVDPCTLVARAQAEALIGKLIADPVSKGTRECTYELPAKGIRQTITLTFTWRGGYHDLRAKSRQSALAAEALSGGQKQVEAAVGNHDALDDAAWEHAVFQGTDFLAVKKDVLVTVDLRGIQRDDAHKLVAAALKNL